MSKTAGVVIDDWKQDIFERVLKQAGYAYTVHDGFIKGTKLIKVTTDYVPALAGVIRSANVECARTKGGK